jgi:hypothetical protein
MTARRRSWRVDARNEPRAYRRPKIHHTRNAPFIQPNWFNINTNLPSQKNPSLRTNWRNFQPRRETQPKQNSLKARRRHHRFRKERRSGLWHLMRARRTRIVGFRARPRQFQARIFIGWVGAENSPPPYQ